MSARLFIKPEAATSLTEKRLDASVKKSGGNGLILRADADDLTNAQAVLDASQAPKMPTEPTKRGTDSGQRDARHKAKTIGRKMRQPE